MGITTDATGILRTALPDPRMASGTINALANAIRPPLGKPAMPKPSQSESMKLDAPDQASYPYDLREPNHAQMSSAVKGDDRYQPRASLVVIALRTALLLLFLALFGLVFFFGLTGRE